MHDLVVAVVAVVTVDAVVAVVADDAVVAVDALVAVVAVDVVADDAVIAVNTVVAVDAAQADTKTASTLLCLSPSFATETQNRPRPGPMQFRICAGEKKTRKKNYLSARKG